MPPHLVTNDTVDAISAHYDVTMVRGAISALYGYAFTRVIDSRDTLSQ